MAMSLLVGRSQKFDDDREMAAQRDTAVEYGSTGHGNQANHAIKRRYGNVMIKERRDDSHQQGKKASKTKDKVGVETKSGVLTIIIYKGSVNFV
eukprot:scaffold9371_cov211-Amphora_coffeaeformis.AAC.22